MKIISATAQQDRETLFGISKTKKHTNYKNSVYTLQLEVYVYVV